MSDEKSIFFFRFCIIVICLFFLLINSLSGIINIFCQSENEYINDKFEAAIEAHIDYKDIFFTDHKYKVQVEWEVNLFPEINEGKVEFELQYYYKYKQFRMWTRNEFTYSFLDIQNELLQQSREDIYKICMKNAKVIENESSV